MIDLVKICAFALFASLISSSAVAQGHRGKHTSTPSSEIDSDAHDPPSLRMPRILVNAANSEHVFDAIGSAVQQCWNLGASSTDAMRTTVIVGVSMNRDGTPAFGSIRLISSEGGTQDSVTQAYEAARRAIIRCGARGFPLPEAKYDHWRDIEMTFNPDGMRLR